MELKQNERLDEVNDKLSLIQDTEGLYFGTDALLLAGYVNGSCKRAVEFGGGTGIISMLLLSRGKVDAIDCIEVQPSFAELIDRNAILNGLCDRLNVVNCDVRDYHGRGECDMVFTNPPYMKNNSGKECENEKKHIARHEVFGDISEFCACAAKNLRFGGIFYVVYRPDRLCDLLTSMRNSGIEPKRATFVHSNSNTPPSMVLVEGKRGGKSSMKITCPLIIYSSSDCKSYSDDMEYILAKGSFPAKFKK